MDTEPREGVINTSRKGVIKFFLRILGFCAFLLASLPAALFSGLARYARRSFSWYLKYTTFYSKIEHPFSSFFKLICFWPPDVQEQLFINIR